MRFAKYHGLGNDFVLINGFRESTSGVDWSGTSRIWCDRHFGIGADGVILLLPGDRQPFRMRMFNPDGSESEMCGNGLRCLAAAIADDGMADPEVRYEIETLGGDRWAQADGGFWRTDLGDFRTEAAGMGLTGAPEGPLLDLPWEHSGSMLAVSVVDLGNPHLVVFGPPVADVPLEDWGPALERHLWFPNRTNVHFAEVVGDHRLRIRHWERGAGATQACGTGAAACAVAAHLTGRTGPGVELELPGGRALAEIRGGRVELVGPAVFVFAGRWLSPLPQA